jgi:uncharacterized protein YaeQ
MSTRSMMPRFHDLIARPIFHSRRLNQRGIIRAFCGAGMALKSTIFKADLQVADLDRGHFADYALTLARHPSETDERMMVRLLAFAIYAGQDLSFGKGISTDEEPALWEVDPAGVIKLWVEVGLPDETRIRKACHKAERAVVLTYGGRAVDMWWKQNADALKRFENLEIWQLSVEEGEALASLAERKMKLSCTLQEGTIYLETIEIRPGRLQ